MTVDEALKYIISMGVVAPRPNARSVRGAGTDGAAHRAPSTSSEIQN
jgi:uncharacterized membrane protein